MFGKPILRETTRNLSLSKTKRFCNMDTVKRVIYKNPGNVTTYFKQFHGATTFSPNAVSYSQLINSKKVKLNEIKFFSVLAEKKNLLANTNNEIKDEEQKDKGLTSVSSQVALPKNVIDIIRQEFEEADLNKDGRIDANELKALLRKHKPLFSESEILEISEVFYAGNAGKSVSFIKLLSAIEDTLYDPSSPDGKKKQKNTLGLGTCAAEYYYDLNHHQWKPEELDIELTHIEPKTFTDHAALNAVKAVRFVFDTATGWNGDITKKKVLRRVIFLETIAAVPGMVAAIIRHFSSLRNMERDGGLINMFLEEATNERMHLLSFVNLRDPSYMFRAAVIGSQFVFGSGFLLAYILSPKFCHRFVGYIEEEACSTYTKIIESIEAAPEGSDLAIWKTEGAPKIAISYWHLGENGTVLDLMYAVRADEAEHRDVNHTVVQMNPGDVNPRFDPANKVDQALNKYVADIMTRSRDP